MIFKPILTTSSLTCSSKINYIHLMPRNAPNELNIANGPQEIPNIKMDYDGVCQV